LVPFVPLLLALQSPISGLAYLPSPAGEAPPGFTRVADLPPKLTDLVRASKCKVDSYRFYNYPKFHDLPTQVGMTASADGWCWTAPKRKDGSGFAGAVQTQPNHGQVAIVADANGLNRFAYRPVAGYVGPDHFAVVLYPYQTVLEFTVNVQAASQ
jgi:hypothetical protein